MRLVKRREPKNHLGSMGSPQVRCGANKRVGRWTQSSLGVSCGKCKRLIKKDDEQRAVRDGIPAKLKKCLKEIRLMSRDLERDLKMAGRP